MMSNRRSLAIRYIEEDIRIHREWAAYIAALPRRRVSADVGDVAHHRKWIRRLTLVLKEIKNGK